MESRSHILLAHMRTYDHGEVDLAPSGCEYDIRTGAWVLKESGGFLVQSVAHPRPQMKKADVETGEDQKGY